MARRPRDKELADMRRILSILSDMPTPMRRRVWQYVNDRVELLPPFLPSRDAEQPGPDLLETA